MNDLAKKLIAFHLGDPNVYDLNFPEIERIGIDPGFIEPKLNNLAEAEQMEIVGDVDKAESTQVVVWNNTPVATRNSILGSCIETYDRLVQKYNLRGNAADIRRNIMQRYQGRDALGNQYVMSRTQLSQRMGMNGSYNL